MLADKITAAGTAQLEGQVDLFVFRLVDRGFRKVRCHRRPGLWKECHRCPNGHRHHQGKTGSSPEKPPGPPAFPAAASRDGVTQERGLPAPVAERGGRDGQLRLHGLLKLFLHRLEQGLAEEFVKVLVFHGAYPSCNSLAWSIFRPRWTRLVTVDKGR